MTSALEQAEHPLGLRELMGKAGIHPRDRSLAKRAIHDLVRSGAVAMRGQRFASPRQTHARQKKPSTSRQLLEGTLQVHRDGFGFVRPASGQGEDIYLPMAEAGRALDGDRVRVRVGPGHRSSGQLIEVLERDRREAVGLYARRGAKAFVLPHDPALPSPIEVPPTQLAREGDWVKVRLGVGKQCLEPEEGLFGEVVGSLGRPGEPSGEVLSIAFSRGFSDEFPPEVIDEADRISPVISAEERAGDGRVDLTSMPLVTIDGEDARDFDDAVYAEAEQGGWRLWVAIADVSHYVRGGEPLDAEAMRRGTSVYLPDRVLPMLPERLSAGICSLRPEENRLCLVAEMTLGPSAEWRGTRLYPAVIRSAARCTYEEVQAVLDGIDVPERNRFRPMFQTLFEVSQALRAMRAERGAIDFDLPELKVVVGADGEPARLEARERKPSHRLIEECMIAANEAVARYFLEHDLPCVFRHHDYPDPEKLAVFADLARAHGFRLPKEKITSKQLNDFISRLEGHPEKRALNQLLLRSMKQAIYSASAPTHYGLASSHYLHFTSPIRRYPDLIVHRLLKQHWSKGAASASPETWHPNLARSKGTAKGARRHGAPALDRERLEGIAERSSDRERAAVEVEREVVAYYSARLMKDRVGERFSATVSGLAEFGFFVQLDEEKVEGLVKGKGDQERHRFDPKTHSLTLGGGRRIRVGEQLIVELVNVNIGRRQIDFALVQPKDRGAKEGRAATHPSRRRSRRR